MSCLYKIREAKDSLTATDKKIAEYVLENPRKVIESSAQELSKESKTSSSAWIRFSKRLGYKGLTALKMDIVKDINLEDNDNLFDVVTKKNDSTEILIKKVSKLSEKIVTQTYKLVDIKSLDLAISYLLDAQKIYLMGVGGSGIVCNDLMHKLSRIDKNVIYHEDSHILFTRLAYCQDNDVLIAISYSGETDIVNKAVKHVKERGVPVIAITQYNLKSPLAKNADVALYLPVEEKDLRLGAITSRNSSLMVTDLLYYGVAKENFDETKKNLIETRKLIRKIR